MEKYLRIGLMLVAIVAIGLSVGCGSSDDADPVTFNEAIESIQDAKIPGLQKAS